MPGGGSSCGDTSRRSPSLLQLTKVMAANSAAHSAAGSIPDDRLSIEKRSDGAILVRVQSAGAAGERLPDAVFSFRCGDPQYSYWLGRLNAAAPRG